MDLADGSSLCGRGARNGRYVLTAVPNPRIAIVYQNDDLGKDFVSGFKSGLGDKAASTIVSEQSYDVSDPTIQSQMVSAKASGANVLYFAGTVKYAIMNIRIRHELGWEPVHLICSTAAGVETTMKGAGFDKAEGVISTSYIKHPNDARWEDEEEVQAFMAWMKENLPNKSPKDNGAVVGYMTSYLMAEILLKAGSTLTRARLMQIATHLNDVKIPLPLPGITISTSPENYSVIDKFQVQRFEKGKWAPVGNLVSGY